MAEALTARDRSRPAGDAAGSDATPDKSTQPEKPDDQSQRAALTVPGRWASVTDSRRVRRFAISSSESVFETLDMVPGSLVRIPVL